MVHRTAIVILNWNTRNYLEKFLPGVIKYSSEVADIIVADNSSTDDSVSYVKSNFPSVHIIQNDSNDGYTGGYNSALKHVNAEYYVLLNSDVEVTENWLQPLISVMEREKNVGACQPKILSFYEPESFEYAGAAGGFIDKYGYPFCRGRLFNTLEKDINQYNDSRKVFWATGACMLVRSNVFKEMKGFDDNFFAHMEEIDLCWRMQRAGYQVHYCGNSKVYHVGGGTLPKSNPHKTYLNFRNNLIMIYKNAENSRVKGIMKTRVILDFIASMKFLISGSLADFKAVWKAHRDFKNLRSQYIRPLEEHDGEKLKAGFLIYPKSILWDYYLCRRQKFSSLEWKEVN
jgi:GT2 family glycosyltransferase